MLKEKIVTYLRNQTAFFDFEVISDVFTTETLAQIFKVKRNTVSHYLNQFVAKNLLIKINTRPVYFLHKEAFEQQFYQVNRTVFASLEELKDLKPKFNHQSDIFSILIGFDGSLTRSIEQLKTAALYPNDGLPVLITGDSGTGKSYTVKVFHQYCIQQELIAEDGPFVTFNCAQYANNPELLSSSLFGYVKGAFTGAVADQIGSFEAADGGLLFLDEVHRLTPEGQEKLFTYLDQGLIYRIGETVKSHSVNVRLAFATTEELDSTFLTTFLRRIPIQIELPSLSKRTVSERKELIYSFFVNEAGKVNRGIRLTEQLMMVLRSGDYKGNIGELKNIIKYVVARAYARQREEEVIQLTIYDLPREILIPPEAVLLSSSDDSEVLLAKDTDLSTLRMKKSLVQQKIIWTYHQLLAHYQQSKDLKVAKPKMDQLVDQLLDYLVFETENQVNQELFNFVSHYVKDVSSQMAHSYQVHFKGNSIYTMSYYLFQRSFIKWVPESDDIKGKLAQFSKEMAESYSESYYLSNRLLELIAKKLDLEVFEMDIIILTIYFEKLSLTKETNYPKAIIVAHGFSTASSIANVANRLLNRNLFESFDMPLDISSTKITEEIINFAQHTDVSNGLIILVDMGSLTAIYKELMNTLTVPIAIVNNVTTQIALSIGEKILGNESLPKMMEAILAENQLTYELIYPDISKQQVIITTCFTGIGTASKLKSLLENSMPDSLDIVILSYEFNDLKHEQERETIFSLYDVLAIVGTANPEIPDVTYISIEEFISGEGFSKLNRLLNRQVDGETVKEINDALIKNFSLEKVIDAVTILDTERVMETVEQFIKYYETLANNRISTNHKLALYVHVSCLIERLVRNVPIETYRWQQDMSQRQKKVLDKMKKAFSVIEEAYSVTVPDSELAYIDDILFQKTDTTMAEEDF